MVTEETRQRVKPTVPVPSLWPGQENGWDQGPTDDHLMNVPATEHGGENHIVLANHHDYVPPPWLNSSLAIHARILTDIQKTRVAIGNRIKAMEGNGIADVLIPAGAVPMVFALLKDAEKALHKALVTEAKGHFMRDWVERTPGIGLYGFALLIGITGPLDHFSTVSKLWKYLGLHVTSEGTAPKLHKGQRLIPRAEADELGIEATAYSSQGRALCRNLGMAIVCANKGPHREAYDRKKVEYQAERLEWTPLHCDLAARRYAVKMLIKDMWVEWQRRKDQGLTTS